MFPQKPTFSEGLSWGTHNPTGEVVSQSTDPFAPLWTFLLGLPHPQCVEILHLSPSGFKLMNQAHGRGARSPHGRFREKVPSKTKFLLGFSAFQAWQTFFPSEIAIFAGFFLPVSPAMGAPEEEEDDCARWQEWDPWLKTKKNFLLKHCPICLPTEKHSPTFLSVLDVSPFLTSWTNTTVLHFFISGFEISCPYRLIKNVVLTILPQCLTIWAPRVSRLNSWLYIAKHCPEVVSVQTFKNVYRRYLRSVSQ